MKQQEQSSWGPTKRPVLWASGGIAALAFLIVVVGGYAFGWEWTGLPKRTFWDWLKLLIIPIFIAGGTLWFNKRQKEIEEKQAIHDEMVKALQDEKESVAYIAVRVREQGLPGDNKERRAQLLMALYLAMLFQRADRSRALVYSALRDSCQKEYRKEVMETLKRLIEDFTRYKDDLSAVQQKFTVENLSAVQQKLAEQKKLGFDISSMDKHIERLKVLEKALSEQKEMGSAARKTEESYRA